MTLTPGTRLGPYEIVSPLGSGGMGVVYRARDTRLGRDVAVKVLPASLSGNPEVRARFEREARTVSSLNHPHICVLHDVGREGATDYLVMELVEGETLAQRLERGALPPAEVLRIGIQIADALDRAHRAGVVHRDLKPGNVMLMKSGAKLMDFGLARATGMAPAPGSGVTSAGLSHSPTVAQPLTAEGTIIGTFQYMAPEQLEGQEADARADLWALGCVLHEMATGRRAFEGRSQASLIGAIMHSEPQPVSRLAPMAPAALDRLVRACLAKDPAERIQSAHDVKLQLEWIAEGAGASPEAAATTAPAAPTPAKTRPNWLAFALVGLAAAGLTALGMVALGRGRSAPAAGGTMQRYILGAADLTPTSAPALSPDGRYAVFSVRDGPSRRLYRRDLGSFELAAIPGTEGGQAPFFSPDGAWIGFSTPEAMKKVPAVGGVAQVILSEARLDASDWGRDGWIYFTPRNGGQTGTAALGRVREAGGAPEVVAVLDSSAGEVEAWLPEILPDGRTVLISIDGGAGARWRVVAISPDGARHVVVENAFLARYVAPGYLLYYDNDAQAVLAAPFDAGKARTTGPAVPLTEQVDDNYAFDVGQDGKLLYVPQPGASAGDLVVWLDARGKVEPVMDTRGGWTQPRVSPDGKRILLRKVATNCELWVYDVERTSLARVAQGLDHHDAVWGPDGQRVAFRRANAPQAVMTISIGGARESGVLEGVPGTAEPQGWSAGGGRLVYALSGRATRGDIWVLPMDGSGPPVPFVTTAAEETQPTISSDGNWIAYVSNETGTDEVFVRRYPDTGTAWQISTGGGTSPLWSRDGRELYFVSGQKMMAVPVQPQPAFRAGVPVERLAGGFNTSRARDFDVAPDGRFVAIARAAGEGSRQELRMLLNWEQELKRLTAAGH